MLSIMPFKQTIMTKTNSSTSNNVFRREYEKRCPNFPPEFETRLREIIKTSDITRIIRHAKVNLAEYFTHSEAIDWKAIAEFMRHPQQRESAIATPASFAIGDYVYSQFGIEILRQEFLVNDIFVFPMDDRWRFIMRSLSSIFRNHQKAYYSVKSPKITIDGHPYTIAYTSHCIQRIHQRVSRGRLTYPALGDTFSYIYETSYFGPSRLSDGSLALILYDSIQEDTIQFRILERVLGSKYYPDANYMYRIGYLPIDISGEFVVAHTLLCPGFKKTPEFMQLKASGVGQEWLDRATENERNGSIDTYDLDLIKLIHDSGLPQVMESVPDLFEHR